MLRERPRSAVAISLLSSFAEDPVTGSAHCCLGPYWSKRLGKHEFVALQASERSGVVRVRTNGDRVAIAGQAVTVMQGTLVANPRPIPA